MSDKLKQLIDKILYAVVIAMMILFAFGLIFEIGAMARISLWTLMFTCAAMSGMQVYEYLWRNKDTQKEKPLLIQMIAVVVITLAVISLTIFMLNGKIITLPV